MAPRASAIKEQGFSEAVAARIEAPQKAINQITLLGKVDHFYKVEPQQSGFVYEFTQVPSNLPADQAVVIQQLPIG